ncbi:hypothetical protein BB561_005603 [Smittium simulii]|uniref:Actin-related protein 5 n=1 Tax=Smittium simulii TaxID=133385 RepID=A0A2T9Y9J9_9FUNG|nr:hypothetical protein BB561_005603 [Smittium simulii]
MTLPQIYSAPEIPVLENLQKKFTDYQNFKNNTPIVIDYGSETCRAGWATEEDPRLTFQNIVSKFKTKKSAFKNSILVGNDVYSDPLAYPNYRSPYDNGIVNNFDLVENTLDYIFVILGINTESIEHPIVMTEPLANLYASRKCMNELLFECYSTSSVAYGIDSLWSYYYNTQNLNINPNEDSIIISTGNYFTNIIPVFSGKPQIQHAVRINVGGNSMADFMLRLIQTKYPSLPVKINDYQSKLLTYNHTYFANDYAESLECSLNKNNLSNFDHIIQFPYKTISVIEKSQEEIEQQAEKRKENAKNLQRIAVRVRQEKLEKKGTEKIELLELLDEINKLDELDSSHAIKIKSLLKQNDFYSKKEIEDEVKKIEATLKRARDKDLGIDPNENKEPHKFDLIDIPDDQLNAEDLKEKRKQKLIKANIDARERMRLAKIEEQKKMDQEKKKDNELKKNNFDFWLTQIKNKRQAILDKIDSKKNLKSELSNRRSHASQQRMKNIADLASNETPSTGTRRKRQEDSDDNFGQDDSDWNVYLDISKDNLDEDDNPEAELIQINELLFENDPEYLKNLDNKARDEIENKILYRFYSGNLEAILTDTAVPKEHSFNTSNVGDITETGDSADDNKIITDLDLNDDKNIDSLPNNGAFGLKNEVDEINELTARGNQIHLNVERIRAPEVLFDPSIMGVDQAGLVEAIENIWKKFPKKSLSFTNNIFATGLGFTNIPGFKDRLKKDLTSIFPVDTDINIKLGNTLGNDAWKGAALWSRTLFEGSENSDYVRSLQSNSITRKQYEEYGSEYLQEHLYSNMYYKQQN